MWICIRAALLCQALIVLFTFFQPLLHHPNRIWKNLVLWKVTQIILILSFGHAEDGEAVGDDEGGQHSPSPSNGTRADHPKATRSVARKRQSASQPTSDRYVCSFLLQSSTFLKFSSTFFNLFSDFKSGEQDAAEFSIWGLCWGWIEGPFHPADSSKGTGTTQPQKSAPASSSNASDASDGGSRALISGPLPKFTLKKLSMKRAST